MKNFFLYFDILVAVLVFIGSLYFKIDFYKIVLMILELMVLIELIQMLFVFFKRQRIKIRYMIDASIIYIIRELLISLTTHPKDIKIITLYTVLIGIFFFFRYLAIKITYNVKEEKLKDF